MTQKLTPEFIDLVNLRLKKGADTYGDEAFKTRTVPASLSEIRDELLDVAAYAALTCAKIESLMVAEVAPPRVSKDLPRNKSLGTYEGAVPYSSLILVLLRNPGCVVFETDYLGAKYAVVADPESNRTFAFTPNYATSSCNCTPSVERPEIVAAAFARGEVYHLPAKP